MVVVFNNDERKAQFERVMNHATERAWIDGVEEEVMSALFDVLDEAAQRRDENDSSGDDVAGRP